MSTLRTYSRIKDQRGVTLIELMISLTIGMVIVLFLTSLFLSSRSSARLGDDNARLQDEARAAMNLIGRNVAQAGFGNLIASNYSETTVRSALTDFAGIPLLGCDFGFAVPGTLANTACAAAGSPAFQVSYMVDSGAAATTGANTDCNGQLAPFDATGVNRMVINRFYLKTKAGETTQSLYCLGNGNGSVEQPLIGNVDVMQVAYGVRPATYAATGAAYSANGFQSIERYAAVSAIGVVNPPTAAEWDRVVSVNVCMELSSPTDNVTPQAQTYTNCAGVATVAADRRLHTVINGVYTLRNNASVRNF